MVTKYINLFLTTLLFGTTSLCPPIGESYTLSIPEHIKIDSNGSFNIDLVDADIKDSISINIDDSFKLEDAHGKEPIYGKVSNTNLLFDPNNKDSKTVYYSIDDIPVGEWTGELKLSICLDKKAETNVLISGNEINTILSNLNPSIITFSHDSVAGNYLYDLSSANDNSILLYQNGDECIITNNSASKINANVDMSHVFDGLAANAINNIDYIDMSRCEDLSYAFNNMKNCTTIVGIENLDVSNIKSFSHLLCGDTNLASVPNLQNWSVTNKCKDISYMFDSICYVPKKSNKSRWPSSVDYSNWDVSNVTNMEHTFANAFMVETFNLDGWITSNVTNMNGMFKMKDNNEKSRLKTIIGISGFDVSKVSDMSELFYMCRLLDENNDISLWTPTSLVSLDRAFYDTRRFNLHMLDEWSQYFDPNSISKTDCFALDSGYYTDPGYRPWQ